MTSLAALLFVCVVAVTSGQMSIDLRTGAENGPLEFTSASSGTKWVVGPPSIPHNTECNLQGVLNVTFDTRGRQHLRLVMTFSPSPTGHPFQVGDSEFNSNHAGDGGHQSNDANIFFEGANVYVYGRDEPTTLRSYGLLHQIDNFVNNTVTMDVMDGLVTIRSGENSIYFRTSKLFQLKGQRDLETGGPNYDVFVAMNRLVSSQSGTGLCSVSFSWISD